MSFTLKIEKALLNKKGSERLTHGKLEKIKWLLNSFSSLGVRWMSYMQRKN